MNSCPIDEKRQKIFNDDRLVDTVVRKLEKKNEKGALTCINYMLAEWLMFQVADLARIMEAAVEAECVKVIRALHQKWPMIVDITDSTGSTPLFEAACRGQDAMIYLLGELGAKSFLWCGDDAVTPMEAAIMPATRLR